MSLKTIFDNSFIENFLLNLFFNTINFVIFFIVLFFIHKILNKKFQKNNIINEELIKKVFYPIYWLIIILCVLSISKLIFESIPNLKIDLKNFVSNFEKIKKIITVIFIGLSSFYFVKYFQKNYISDWKQKADEAKRNGNEVKEIDVSQIDFIAKIITIIIFLILLFSIMGSLGVNLSGLAAIGGASGLIVGFATKDLFSNFFGLFSVYLDKTFKIGDNINITDNNIKGVIEEIGLRTTKIRTNDQTVIYVPNSIFNTSIIENISRLTFRVLRYEMKIKNKSGDFLEKLSNVTELLRQQILELDIVPKIEYNPRIFTSHLNDYFIDLKFIISLIPSNQANFEANSNIVINLIYKIMNNEGFEVISPIPDINIQSNSSKIN